MKVSKKQVTILSSIIGAVALIAVAFITGIFSKGTKVDGAQEEKELIVQDSPEILRQGTSCFTLDTSTFK